MTKALSFAEREQRKRMIISYALAIGLYALLFGVSLLLDFLYPPMLDLSNKTLLVNIQGPVANDIGQGSPETKKDTVVPENPAPPPAAASKPKLQTAAKTAPAAPSPSPVAETQSASAAPAAQQPAEPWIPGERGPGSRVSSSESSQLLPGEGQVPWGRGEATRITKAEKGNTVETTLGGSSDTVGQSLYVPVYLNMPLPSNISTALFNAIPDEIIPPHLVIASAEARKRAFLNYYAKRGDSYMLASQPPLEVREKLWEMLEDAGYNVEQADYKAGRSLNPVVIGFSVTRDRQLRGVELLQSSGDPDIDAAVLYGFKRASFWNKSGDTIQGRFVYRF